MTALKRQVANRDMRFNESEIRKKMDEIADWLKDQPSPAKPSALKAADTQAAPTGAPVSNDMSPTLESIASNRLAARRQREAEDREGMRSVMSRFSGPIAPDASVRGPLSSAVAEIMERQRELDSRRDAHPEAARAFSDLRPVAQEPRPVPSASHSEPQHTGMDRRDIPRWDMLQPDMRRDDLRRDDARPEVVHRDAARHTEMHDRGAQMEASFERFVARFEARAEQTFQTLESSLGEVRRLLDEAKTPVEAAEAAAAYIVQTRLHDLEAGTNSKIEEVARGLAELRTETSESERRTRDLLDAVRATLEHVASRLPERHGHRPVILPETLAAAEPAPAPMMRAAPAFSGAEAPTPANAPAAEPEPNITLRVREAARRAMEDSAEEEPLNLGPRVNSATPERRRFIAAARRSTEGEAEPAIKYRPAGTHAPRASHPLPDPQAAKPAKRGAFKRVLLTGTAAAVLVLGIYAGSSRLLDSLMTSQEVAAVAPEPKLAAAPTRVIPPVPVPPGTQQALSNLFSTEPVSGAQNFGQDEPVVTGSIAAPMVEYPALPEAIGGAQLRQLAQSGDAAAQHEVAMRFAEGRGVERDQALALQWFRYAADQGLAPAQYRLASMLEKGMGAPKDLPQARDLYEKAAQAGNVQAMHNVGVIYAEGGLGEPDLAAAFDWFRKAADYGVKDSQYNLGIFYAKGLSTTQDFAQSYLWFALAAAQGDKDAAAKRDQISAKLDPERVTALRITADTWRPKASQPEANNVAAPEQGWDAPASGRTNVSALQKPY